jgi:hypothetical protein
VSGSHPNWAERTSFKVQALLIALLALVFGVLAVAGLVSGRDSGAGFYAVLAVTSSCATLRRWRRGRRRQP